MSREMMKCDDEMCIDKRENLYNLYKKHIQGYKRERERERERENQTGRERETEREREIDGISHSGV